MKTVDIFQKKQTFSLEIFPPKRTSPVKTIYDTVSELTEINPDFISVTYGAGGTSNNSSTLTIASSIKKDYHIESVAHLPCIHLKKSEVKHILENLKEHKIENILALRGDINPEYPCCEDFKYATDLVKFIKENGDFNIIGACYPEGHRDSKNSIEDIKHLKEKVDAGTSQLITQLFFDNNYFYSFKEKAEIAGINVPIEAGIMPVVNKRQIQSMVTLCQVDLPRKFLAIMERYENNPQAMRDAGIAYAVDQIVDLIANGVDGIHLYTMNNPYIAKKIYAAISSLIAA